MKFLAFFLSLLALSAAEKLTKCQLVSDLKNKGVLSSQIPTWVCIATAESALNTAAEGVPNENLSRDYGIFQINSKYWCSGGPAPDVNGCGITCASLLDNDISNDIACALKIHSQSANGFGAWSTYAGHCEGRDLSSYVAGC